jgi:hypothetical protein
MPHPVAPPPSSNGWYSVLATGVIAIPLSGPETVHSVKVFNLVFQINKQTDDSTLLDIQTRLSDKKKREISDCLNDTLTNPCSQKFAKTTVPSNTENISNVGSNEKKSSDINTTDVDFLFADTDFTLILNCKMYPQQMFQVQSVQSRPIQLNSLMEANNRNVKMPAVFNYNCTVHFNFYSK